MNETGRHHVVVVGGGFGGLQAVQKLRRGPVDVTLVDRRNFHLFQPLTYQIATGALSPGEVAYPLRAIFKRSRNVRVLMADVTGFDLDAREVMLESAAGVPTPSSLGYDSLIVAGGSSYSYFGHEDWREPAPEVKSLESALEVRRRILSALEAAELESDPERRQAWLTFVVVGAGPTGVEMAGQIAEIANDTLPRDFANVDPRSARILLIEAADRVLTSFPERLSARAFRSLERLGVTPVLDRSVVDLDDHSVTIEATDGERDERSGGEPSGRDTISAHTIIWAAGVRASGLAAALGEATGAAVDRAGRVSVGPDLTLPGHPELFAIGDMVEVHDAAGRPQHLPGVAPTAMQEGRYVAKVIAGRLDGAEPEPFRYVDKGNVATIGRLKAVMDIKGVRLSGTIAWLGYLFIHLFYLIGLENRVLVFIRWIVSFVTRGQGSRLITGRRAEVGDRTPT